MARRKATDKTDEPPVSVAGEWLTDEERIARLEEAVNRQLDFILQNEVTDLASRIRDIKAAMDMIRTIKTDGAVKAAPQPVEISFLD